jgi:hypothetical protein
VIEQLALGVITVTEFEETEILKGSRIGTNRRSVKATLDSLQAGWKFFGRDGPGGNRFVATSVVISVVG